MVQILTALGLFLAGILAGMELVVRYGIHPALMRLSDRAHLEARHEVVRIVRVIVPAVLLPSVLVGVAVAILSGSHAGSAAGSHAGSDAGSLWRWTAVGAYLAYLLVVFLGTVPINNRFYAWDPANPPDGWQAVIRRWALIDIVRSSLAVIAFALFLVAAVIAHA